MRRNVDTHTKARAKQLRAELTPAEKKLWSRLRAKQFLGLRVRRQHPVGPYIADFCIPHEKLVIELDGPSHNAQMRQDEQRDSYLKEQGYRVVRIRNQDILSRIDDVLEYLGTLCKGQFQPPS